MTRKDKELLLKDLCARLPYGVKIHSNEYNGVWNIYSINPNGEVYVTDYINSPFPSYYETCKPYLFPISSMTERQKKKYYSLADDVTIKPEQGSYFGIKIHCIKLGISDNPHEGVWDWIDLDAVDWLNKNHFDYRGLIDKGLAIDATGLNIY